MAVTIPRMRSTAAEAVKGGDAAETSPRPMPGGVKLRRPNRVKATLALLVIVLAALIDNAATTNAAPTSTTAMLAKSTHVLRFFDNHRWLTAPRTDRCKQVPWTRSCLIARERVRFHTRRLVALELQLPPVEAICRVFGRYCDQALAVTRCESGASRTPRAVNGQYLGMFQMGDFARSTYGHGATPIEQARAAWRYFDASGRDWSPWSCKPW